MARVAQLVVDIDARTQGLEASMRKTREEIAQVGATAQQTSAKIDSASNSLGNFVTLMRRTAIGAGIIEGFRLVQQAIEQTVTDLSKLSDEAAQAKIDPENYQVIQIMAERTGRSMQDLIKVVDTSTGSFQKFKDTVRGEIIPREYIEQAKRLQNAQNEIQRQINVELVPGLLELRRTEIIAKGALTELTEEWLKTVTSTNSFKDAMKVVNEYVAAGIVHFNVFVDAVAQAGSVLATLGRIANEVGASIASVISQTTALATKQALENAQGEDLTGYTKAYADSLADVDKANKAATESGDRLNAMVGTLSNQFARSGERSEEAARRGQAAVAGITHTVDDALKKPSVPDAITKGSDKAARELERLKQLLAELDKQTQDIGREYEQAQARLVAVQSGGTEALRLVEDQQKVADAYQKTYDSVHKAAEAARLSTEEQDRQAKSAAGLAAQTVTLNEKISQTASDQKLLQDAFEGTWTEAEKVDAQMRKLHDAADRLGVVVSGDQWDKIHESLSKTNDDMKELSDQIQSSVVGAFEDLGMSLVQGKLDMQEFTRQFLLDIGRIILRLSIMKAITAAMGMFGGGGSAGTAPLGNLNATGTPGLTLGARGMVLEYGNAAPFATGGIISRPTLFPMANGAGLMGEAGPEAVMPLARTSSGELGVKGGGSNVVINIMTPAGTEASTERHQDASGNEQIDVIIQSRMERLMATGRMDNAMRANYGVTRAGRR